jgi:acylphosphatase
MICKRLIIQGKVQGIGYRYFAQKIAEELKVKGRIKNLENGNVEAVVCCKDDATFEKIFLLFKKGPILSRIDQIIIKDANTENCEFEGFQIEH